MIRVIAVNVVKEGCDEAFLELARVLVEKTNALDPGCIKYELCRDVSDPSKLVMLEEWEDQKSIDDHLKASHFLEIAPKMGPLTTKPTELTILSKLF